LKNGLKDAERNINDLQQASKSQHLLLSTHSQDIHNLQQQTLKTDQKLENLENSIRKQEDSVTIIKNQIHQTAQLTDDHAKLLKSHSDEISSLKKYLNSINNTSGTGSTDALSDLDRRINLLDSKYISNYESINNQMGDFEKDIKTMKANIQKNTEEILDIKKNLKKFEESLKNKVEVSDFDRYKLLRPSGETQSSIGNQYIDIIEELQRDIQILTKKTEDLPILSNNLQILSNKISEIEEKLKKKIDSSEVLLLLSNSKPGENNKDPNIPSILKRLSELEEKLESLMKIINNKDSSSDSNLLKLINDLKSLIDTKVSINDLKALEERLQEKVIAVCEAMGNKFADRSDTKKALRHLESLIREYFESGVKRPTGDDAMFAKKPLGGWSCASCETNLEKLKGISAAYYSWNKMPYRDPNDRIARAGPGFSRMLATIQPENIPSRVRTAQNKVSGQIEEDFPPDPRSIPSNKKPARPTSAYYH
jgi:chromosome segregation ATPase